MADDQNKSDNKLDTPANIVSVLFLVIIALSFIAYYDKFSQDQIISLIKIFTWPFTIVILAEYFKDELKKFLGRVINVKLPGGTELQASQDSTQKIVDNETTLTTNNTDFEILKNILVPNTKAALRWFNDKGTITEDFFILNFALPNPPDAISGFNLIQEKKAIFLALYNNRLLENHLTDQFKISEKGKRFLRFVGFLN